jgi:hypothetical protein
VALSNAMTESSRLTHAAPANTKQSSLPSDAWTEGQMFSSGLPRPHFAGSVVFTVPPTGKVEPIEVKLRDAFKKAG